MVSWQPTFDKIDEGPCLQIDFNMPWRLLFEGMHEKLERNTSSDGFKKVQMMIYKVQNLNFKLGQPDWKHFQSITAPMKSEVFHKFSCLFTFFSCLFTQVSWLFTHISCLFTICKSWGINVKCFKRLQRYLVAEM